ncbi:choice-of-anchor M domain-containing protein [Pseudolysinimonas sp.]|jgi:surface-anchored protein|uniref:choice-of-anchor M domain-containing protein n=1 Tax=Pseudolysinimonas sp. TaxID=2680009 RepID=UPI0037840BF0
MLTRLTPAVAAALTVVLVVIGPAAAQDDPEPDPNLDQQITDSQPIVDGEAVLDAGHVDLGPRYLDGTWTLLVHDDVARAEAGAQSVWRHLEQTVLQVADAARQVVPDDGAYEFLGVAPGDEVFVVPQSQNPDVIWLGWNTQDPDVMATIDRGVTLSLSGVEGPGDVHVFLQSGAFGDPDPLWDSRLDEAQPLWVDVNTHTHANWVFTEPGIYLIQLTAEADLLDGSTVRDTRELRFAVGSTDPSDALAAVWAGGGPTIDEDAGSGSEPDGASADPLVAFLLAAIVLAAVLAAVFIVIAARSGAAKRRGLSRESQS